MTRLCRQEYPQKRSTPPPTRTRRRSTRSLRLRRRGTQSHRQARPSPRTSARRRCSFRHWVDWRDAVIDRVGNILLSPLMGADVRLSPAGSASGSRSPGGRRSRTSEESGGTPYAIPAGASDHRLGGLGFANWAHEVAAQERELGVFFDTIVVCSVTGSTHAGMIAGFADLEQNFGGPGRRVIASMPRRRSTRPATRSLASPEDGRADRRSDVNCATTRPSCSRAGRRRDGSPQSNDQAMKLTGRLEGVIIDPVYEGKSMAGLIDLVSSGDIPRTPTCSTPTWAASPRSTRTAAATTEQSESSGCRCAAPSVAAP